MKSSGIMCSSIQNQTGKHSFLFSLRALEPKNNRNSSVTLDFAPTHQNIQQAPKVSTASESGVFDFSRLLPCFSIGSQPRLNGFVTLSEQETFQQQNKLILSRLCKESSTCQYGKTQIMEAKPRSTYCQICKETFSDYLKHLSHPIHVKNFQAQRQNARIDELIQGLQEECMSVNRVRRCVADEEEEIECQRMPCKVRVIQMQDTLTPTRSNSSSLSKNCYSTSKVLLNSN